MVALAIGCMAVGCTKDLAADSTKGDLQQVVGQIGRPVDDFGIETTVLRIDFHDQSDESFPRLSVTVRSVSKRPAPWQNPDMILRCDGSSDGVDWSDTSTWEPSGGLPPGQIAEGQVVLSFPAKQGATRYPVGSCHNARVVLIGADPTDRNRRIETSYAVPANIVTQAFDADRGA
jgi:hypothetical protein